MQYLELAECYRYFYGGDVFFNLESYQFFNQREMQIYLDELDEPEKFSDKFIQVPPIGKRVIETAFLLKLNNKPLYNRLKHMNDEEFSRIFRLMTEVDTSFSEYGNFTKDYLIQVAINWCLENGIKYTLKTRPRKVWTSQESEESRKRICAEIDRYKQLYKQPITGRHRGSLKKKKR